MDFGSTTAMPDDERPGAFVKRKKMSIIEYMKRKKLGTVEDTAAQKVDHCARSHSQLMLATDSEHAVDDEKPTSARRGIVSQLVKGSAAPFTHAVGQGVAFLYASSKVVSSLTPSIDIPTNFNRSPVCLRILPALTPSESHHVLFRPQILVGIPPRPFPDTYRDNWDHHHVRMPCSSENVYPTADKNIQKRWELIEGTLLQPFMSSKDLEEAILTYNHHYKDKWNFESWHSYCNIELTDKERDELFTSTLPSIVNLALQLPVVVTQSPMLLRSGKQCSLSFTQMQVACLLANAFFCTFPRRNSLKKSEFSNFPDINFSKLFRGVKDVVNRVKNQKYKAILHYFRRVLAESPCGTVTYTRQVLSSPVRWDDCKSELSALFVTAEGTIEDCGEGFLQVDFANRMIGGGVVGEGCVQEEIRFLICPELIVARLFTEKLEPNESLLITGVERYSSYTGYAQTFTWTGDYVDFTPRDRWGRRCTELVAIDAHVFHCYSDQFKVVSLRRELDKAYVGFRSTCEPCPEHLQAVVTGNWGCGAFGGSIHVKSLLQLMAATLAMRDVVYLTFSDQEFARELRDMHAFLKSARVTVEQLFQLLVTYGSEMTGLRDHISLYPYIKDRIRNTGHVIKADVGIMEECSLLMRGVPGEIPDDMEPHSPELGDTT